MEQLVVDASVIIKFFVNEMYSEYAQRLRNAIILQEITLAEPSLLNYEVLNGIRFSRAKKFSSDELKMVAKSLENYGFSEFTFKGDIAEAALELTETHDITVYDAAYVALARKLRVKMYTADEILIKKIHSPTLKHIRDFK